MSNKINKIPKVFKPTGVKFNQGVINSLKVNQVLHLECDPTNQYDSNAIKVLTENDRMCGWVPKENGLNKLFCSKFDKFKKYELKVKSVNLWQGQRNEGTIGSEGPTWIELEFFKIQN